MFFFLSRFVLRILFGVDINFIQPFASIFSPFSFASFSPFSHVIFHLSCLQHFSRLFLQFFTAFLRLLTFTFICLLVVFFLFFRAFFFCHFLCLSSVILQLLFLSFSLSFWFLSLPRLYSLRFFVRFLSSSNHLSTFVSIRLFCSFSTILRLIFIAPDIISRVCD